MRMSICTGEQLHVLCNFVQVVQFNCDMTVVALSKYSELRYFMGSIFCCCVCVLIMKETRQGSFICKVLKCIQINIVLLQCLRKNFIEWLCFKMSVY